MKRRTTTGRREDRTRWLRKMLFNLWIKPGLVVLTLICVFIDFVFNFNLSSASLPSHPPSLHSPKRFFTLRLLLPHKTPSVTLLVSANINQYLPLILSLCSHQSFLGHSIPLFPHISLCLCSQSPYMSNGDRIHHTLSQHRQRDVQRRERECMFPKLSHDW